MFNPNLVITVGASVRRSDSEHRAGRSVLEVHDFFSSAIGRIPDGLFPAQRSEEAEVEGEGAFNVADREIDVVNSHGRKRNAASSSSGVGLF